MSKKTDNRTKIQTVIDRNDVSVNANIEENYIFTTEDKIHILYEEYNKARKSICDFWTCVGIFISLLASLVTCDFSKTIFGIDPSTIRAMFILSAIATLVMSVYYLVGWIKNKKKTSFDFFISKIKGD